MYFKKELVIESYDKGETWDYYKGHRTWPTLGCQIFELGECLIAIDNGKTFRRSYDGVTWDSVQQLPSVSDKHYSQIGKWNLCTTTLTSKGLILIAGDYSLGRPDIDPDALCVVSSKDWGDSWQFSRGNYHGLLSCARSGGAGHQ